MKLTYLNRHSQCPHYIGDTPVGFGRLDIEQGEVFQVSSSFGMVVMLLEGEVLITGKQDMSLTVTSRQILALPSHDRFTVHALRKTRAIRLYIIGNKLSFCRSVVSEGKLAQAGSSIYAMPMLPVITMFAEQMDIYIHDKLLCCQIHHLKQRELSALLQGYYRPAMLQRFLAPLYAKDSSFLEKVMELSTGFLTVEQMAERLNMSRSTFIRNFSKNFREPPMRWLTRIRTKALFDALRDSTTSLEEVAKKLKFSSQQSMNAFCRKNIGATPMQVREGEVAMPELIAENE